MKNRNKKVIALLLVGAMTMGLGVSVSASEKISEEGVTLTVAGNKPSGLEDWTNLACIQEYKDRLGINLECDFTETDWPTQRTLLFAGSDYERRIFDQ